MRFNKYGNIKTVVDNIKFDSKAEARRYLELKLLEKAGKISNLELQPRYDIKIGGKYIAHYKADFRYFTAKETVVEDVKGVKTPIYRLKKKLVEALYPGVKIIEVK
tara:strand:+ start:3898 stop:4215 length:318 start_codon:yes stop_codon:yes gene_type:complete